jgi:hypothetical protein
MVLAAFDEQWLTNNRGHWQERFDYVQSSLANLASHLGSSSRKCRLGLAPALLRGRSRNKELGQAPAYLGIRMLPRFLVGFGNFVAPAEVKKRMHAGEAWMFEAGVNSSENSDMCTVHSTYPCPSWRRT